MPKTPAELQTLMDEYFETHRFDVEVAEKDFMKDEVLGEDDD